ncbi:hypothetical protein L1D61_13685 [Vibrio mediterranei]|nr:hypothetical protein [Vibrio mediterranei]
MKRYATLVAVLASIANAELATFESGQVLKADDLNKIVEALSQNRILIA